MGDRVCELSMVVHGYSEVFVYTQRPGEQKSDEYYQRYSEETLVPVEYIGLMLDREPDMEHPLADGSRFRYRIWKRARIYLGFNDKGHFDYEDYDDSFLFEVPDLDQLVSTLHREIRDHYRTPRSMDAHQVPQPT